jgi:hypothetical protein
MVALAASKKVLFSDSEGIRTVAQCNFRGPGEAHGKENHAHKFMNEPQPQLPPSALKQYLGDSVYAECDGFRVILTTENGYPDDPRNRIVLEPEAVYALTRFYERAVERFMGDHEIC